MRSPQMSDFSHPKLFLLNDGDKLLHNLLQYLVLSAAKPSSCGMLK